MPRRATAFGESRPACRPSRRPPRPRRAAGRSGWRTCFPVAIATNFARTGRRPAKTPLPPASWRIRDPGCRTSPLRPRANQWHGTPTVPAQPRAAAVNPQSDRAVRGGGGIPGSGVRPRRRCVAARLPAVGRGLGARVASSVAGRSRYFRAGRARRRWPEGHAKMRKSARACRPSGVSKRTPQPVAGIGQTERAKSFTAVSPQP